MCINGFIGLFARLIIACTYSILITSLLSIKSLPNASIIASFYETSLAELISMLKHLYFLPFVLFIIFIIAINYYNKKITPINFNLNYFFMICLLSLFPYGIYLNESLNKYEVFGKNLEVNLLEKLNILGGNFFVVSRHILQKNITLYLPLMSAKYYFEKAKVTHYVNEMRRLPSFSQLSPLDQLKKAKQNSIVNWRKC